MNWNPDENLDFDAQPPVPQGDPTIRTGERLPEDVMREQITDMTMAYRTASGAADRFRDVLCEVLGRETNPGDDTLVKEIRALLGKDGPEPTRWRERIGAHEPWTGWAP